MSIEHKWELSPHTTPSGKILYHCPVCGLYDPAPVKPKFENRACVAGKYADRWEAVPREDGNGCIVRVRYLHDTPSGPIVTGGTSVESKKPQQDLSKSPVVIELTAREADLIRYIRTQMQFGTVTVFVQESQPVRIETAIKSVKLGV